MRADSGDGCGLVLWSSYLREANEPVMAARVAAIGSVLEAGRSRVALPGGGETCAPLIVAAEAAVAATLGEGEDAWRRRWTETLVRTAVACRDGPTTEGVILLLSLTESIAGDLRAAGVWPWGGSSEAHPPPGQSLQYVEDGTVGVGWGVRGTDYVVWRRLLDKMDDWAAATRIDAVHAAAESGCSESPGGGNGWTPDLLAMIAAEGAVAARAGRSQQQWRREWTDRLVRVVARRGDEETVERVCALIQVTPSVIEDLKYARVWPWLGRPRSVQKPQRRAATRRTALTSATLPMASATNLSPTRRAEVHARQGGAQEA